MSKLFNPQNRDRLGKFILVCCVIFCFVLTFRILNGRFLSAGDAFWHYSNEIHMVKSISEGTGVFGCFQKGMGSPLGNFYQPFFYMLVTGIYFLCLKSLSVFFIHNFLVCLFFSIFPLSVYYLARSFRFTHIKSGVITMFSIVPISGWGHTLDAYFWIGLYTQLIGACMFPIVMGALHRLVWSGRKKRDFWVFVVSFSCLLMGHAVFAMLLVYCLGLYMLFFLIWRGWNSFIGLAKKVFVAGILVFLIVSFWLVPFLEFNHKYKFVPESERSFSRLAVSVTAEELVKVFFTGELLDNTNPESPLFGGGREGFRWSMNESFRRFYVFTFFVCLGMIFIIFRGRKFRDLYFLLLFFWGGCLFLGKDDVNWLSLLPYSRSFQPIRAIFIMELAGAVIAGDVFVRIFKAIINKKISKFIKYSCITVMIVSCFLLLTERYRVARIMVKTQLNSRHKELMDVYSKIKIDDRSRIFSGRSTGLKNTSLRSMSDCYFLNNVTGHDNAMSGNLSHLINNLQKDIPYSRDLLDLLNVKYLLTKHEWRSSSIRIGDVQPELKNLFSGTYFDLHGVKNQSDLFTSFKKKPILVWCDKLTWYKLNRLWLDLFSKHGYDLAPMVKAPDDFSRMLSTGLFSALMLVDFSIGEKNKKLYYKNIRDFSLKGWSVLSNRPLWGIEVEKLLLSNVGIFSRTLLKSPLCEEPIIFKGIKSSWNSYEVNLDVKKTDIVIAKMPFYHTWHVRVGGQETDTLWVSPGFIGVMVYPGDNQFLTLKYEPSWYRMILLLVAVLGIILFFFIQKFVFKENRSPRFFKFNGLMVYRRHFRIVCFAVIASLFLLYAGQFFMGKVALIYPYNGQHKINPEEITFFWNKLDNAQQYRFQLASDQDFTKLVFELNDSEDNTLGYRGLRSYKEYYWRVGSMREKGQMGWSKIYKFKTGNYFPVVADR